MCRARTATRTAPVGLPERLAVAQDAVVAGCRLDGEAGGFEPADELADVLRHSCAPRAKMRLVDEPTTDVARKERPHAALNSRFVPRDLRALGVDRPRRDESSIRGGAGAGEEQSERG